jgi:hypothetical protein
MDMPPTRPSLLSRPNADIPAPTEVRPAVRRWASTTGDPLHRPLREAGYVHLAPAESVGPVSPARPPAAAPPVLDALPEDTAAMRAGLAARRRHQARMDMWIEARAGVWFIFALLACAVLVIVGTLVVGAMLGRWPLPLGGVS